jgi:chemotaxis protein MotB
MTRHALVILLTLGLAAMLAAGCGIPEEQHNAVKKDLENTKIELAELQQQKSETEKKLNEEIATLEARISDLEATKTDLEAKLEDAKGTLQMYESKHGTLEERLEASKVELEELRKQRAQAEKRLERFRDIASRLASMVESGQLSVKIRDGKMVIELASNILFDSGSTRIKSDGEEALGELAGVLQQIKKRSFLVAGHTDNVGRPESNWQLSTARAVEVVKFLQEAGVEPENLAAAGYGEYDPVASNETDDGKALNRRIEIIMMPNLEELPNIPKEVLSGS